MTRTTRVCASGMADHTPMYAEVDAHHIFPLYLSRLIGVPERAERADLCSGCHDLIHHAIHHLINEGTMGRHRLAPGLQVLADRAWRWWQVYSA